MSQDNKQTAKAELLSSQEAAKQGMSTTNIKQGSCADCGCEVLLHYHYGDDARSPVPEAPFTLIDGHKAEISGKTDKNGLCKIENLPCESFEVLFEEGSDTFTPGPSQPNPVVQTSPKYAAFCSEFITLYDLLSREGYVKYDGGSDSKFNLDFSNWSWTTGAGKYQKAFDRLADMEIQVKADPLLQREIKKYESHFAGTQAGKAKDATWMLVAELILGCIPVVGDIYGAVDWLYRGIEKKEGADFGEPLYLAEGGVIIIGFVPLAGDAVQKVCTPIVRFFQKAGKGNIPVDEALRMIRSISNGNVVQYLLKLKGDLAGWIQKAAIEVGKIQAALLTLINEVKEWLTLASPTLFERLLAIVNAFSKIPIWLAKMEAWLKGKIDEFIAAITRRFSGVPYHKGSGKRADLNAGRDANHAGQKPGNGENGADHNKTNGRGACDCNALQGNPIDITTGSVDEHCTDLSLAGKLPLVLHRHYAWRPLQRDVLESNRGLLGYQWMTPWDVVLELQGEEAIFHHHNRQKIWYHLPGEGGWAQNTTNPTYRLTRTAQGFELHPAGGGTIQEFHHAAGARLLLSGLRDSYGNRIQFTRDVTRHFITGAFHSDGQVLGFERKPLEDGGQTLAVTWHETRTARGETLLTYRFNARGYLVDVDGSAAGDFRYQYSPEGHLLRREAHDGIRWGEYTYDAQGRVISSRHAGGYWTAKLEYPRPGLTVYRNPLGGIIRYHYDSQQRLYRIEHCTEGESWREWQGDLLVKQVDALGHETRYHYDAWGQVVETVYPDGHSSGQREYDAIGRLLKDTDTLGNSTHYTYTPDQQHPDPIAVTNAHGETWHYAYTARGQLASMTSPSGAQQQYHYNVRGHWQRLDTFGGQTLHYHTDRYGRIHRLSYDDDGHYRERVYRHDGAFHRSRLVEVTLEDGARYQYRWDAQGLLNRITDPLGHSQHANYGPYGLLKSYTDALGRTTRWHYNAQCQVTTVQNAQGDTYRYQHDTAGRITHETDFSGIATRYRYDVLNRLVAVEQADGSRLHYQYDPRGHLTQRKVVESDGRSHLTHWEYDALGQLAAATNTAASIRLERDALGRVVAETVNGDTLRSAYNADGLRSGVDAPEYQEQRHYQTLGQLGSLQMGAHTPLQFSYTALGQEQQRSNHAGFVQQRRYTASGLPSSQDVWKAFPALEDWEAFEQHQQQDRYRWDAAGHLTDHLNSEGHWRYQYDAAGQITQHALHWSGVPGLDSPPGALREKTHYDYDANQDITQQEHHHSEYPHGETAPRWHHRSVGSAYQQGRLIRQGGLTCRYDALGRLVEKQHTLNGFTPRPQRYRWDALGQLTGYENAQGDRWQYTYDPFGRRIHKQREGNAGEQAKANLTANTAYRWDGDRLAQEIPLYADGTPAWDKAVHWHYEPESYRPIAKRQAGQLYYLVNDPNGTPQAVYTERGDQIQQQSLSLWGSWQPRGDRRRPAANDDPGYLSLRFQGQQYDNESGLHYNRYRYYDPEIRQYLSPDPIGLAGGLRPQGYVHDPVGWVDPLGLATLYHGTSQAGAANIRENGISLSSSRVNTDFGQGFYTTTIREQAEDWVVKRHPSGTVLEFDVDDSEFASLSNKNFPNEVTPDLCECYRHNRSGGTLHSYDTVSGPMLVNVGEFKEGGIAKIHGQQTSFHTQRGVDLLNRSLKK